MSFGTLTTSKVITGEETNSALISDPSRVNDDSYLADHDAPVSAITRHVIGSMYLSRGGDVLRLLYEKPAAVGPIVLERLRQKLAEFLRYRREANRRWHATNEKHFRSLQDMNTGNHYLYQRGVARREILPSALLLRARSAGGYAWNVPDTEPHAAIRDILRNALSAAHSHDGQSRVVSMLNTLFDNFIIPFFDTTNAGTETTTRRKVFYGNASFVLFFGTYSKLYECVSRGLHIGLTTDRVLWRSIMNTDSAPGWMGRFCKLRLTKKCENAPDDDRLTSYFNVFVDAAMACVAGLFDRQTYEEMCTALFAPDIAQTLFPVPTLAESLAERAEELLNSASCDRLLAIYASERISEEEKREFARMEVGNEEECFEFGFEVDGENACNNRFSVVVDRRSSNGTVSNGGGKYLSFDDLPVKLEDEEKFVIGPVIESPPEMKRRKRMKKIVENSNEIEGEEEEDIETLNISPFYDSDDSSVLKRGLKRERKRREGICKDGKYELSIKVNDKVTKVLRFVEEPENPLCKKKAKKNENENEKKEKENEENTDIAMSNDQEESENEKSI